MEDSNLKIEEAKKLLMDYGEVLIQLKRENETLKKQLMEVRKEYKRIPKMIRNHYLKDKEAMRMIEGM